MSRRTPRHGLRRLLLVTLCIAMAAPLGCADASDSETGSLQLALRDGVGGWLRLRIFPDYPGEALEGATSFDTKCLDAQSRTYELSNINAGENQWVVIEAFDSQDCSDESRVELGYRGAIDIAPVSGKNKVSVSEAELMHLVTGYRHADDIFSMKRRMVEPTARGLFQALFPKRTAFVWPVDRF